MKRLSTILVIAAMAMPAKAQLNGDGFYRVQNADSKRYASIVDNKANKTQITSTSNVDVYAINTIEGFSNIVDDPGSIIYIEYNTGNGYILQGQGMNSYNLTGYFLQINLRDNAYTASARYQGIEKRLHEATDSSFGFNYMTSSTKNEDGSTRSNRWNIIPVTDKDEQYFGIKGDIEVEGKYYTTLYASFACELSAGMKAYYVKQNNNDIAELTEISGSTIPASTPVIIECSTNNPADNKVTPLARTVTKNLQNKLAGVYFCNVIRWNTADKEEYKDHPNWNTTNYDPKKMRVLGVVDGKLGWVTDSNLKYLPANKAYLPVSEKANSSLQLVDTETYTTITGIETITEEQPQNTGIYTITGTKVKADDNTEGLTPGIYIIDGKKAIVR